MTQTPHHPSHPVIAGVAGVLDALDRIGEAQPLYLSTTEKAQALRDVVEAEAKLAAVKLSLLAVAGDVAETIGAKDPGSWLAVDQHTDRKAARADHRLAVALDTKWTRVAAALAAGTVHLDQARTIARVLDDLDDLDPDLLTKAEERLVTEAKVLDPTELRILGKRLAEILDPEGAEERDAKRLAEAEARAEQKQRLSFKPLGDGTTRISGLLPDATAHRLRTYLESFAQPRKQAAQADGRVMPYARLLARAFGDFLHAVDPDQMPAHGGDATTVIVTIDYQTLLDDLGTAGLGFDPEGNDLHLTAGHARRLACQAHILPMVLGGPSHVLDAGHTTRLHTPIMRKIIRARDKTCRATGCDVPAQWCEIHHLTPWSHGGRTSVKDGITLCSHHHHRVHDPAYHHQRHPDGTIRFHRRR